MTRVKGFKSNVTKKTLKLMGGPLDEDTTTKPLTYLYDHGLYMDVYTNNENIDTSKP